MQSRTRTDASDLSGLKVFIVEDESLVAMQLEDMLSDIGCEVAGLAMRVKKAEEMLPTLPDLDLAILDVNVAGEQVYPVAHALADRDVSIVFATGYGRSGVLPEWQDRPILQKPYTTEQVVRIMMDALGAPSGKA